MAQQLQPMVRGFKGENRLLPSDLLQPNFGVDGQNNDYSRGTIKKRKGFVKTHANAVKPGGIAIDNTSSAKCCYIKPNNSQFQLNGEFTMEFTVKFLEDPTKNSWDSQIKMINNRSGSSAGWSLDYTRSTGVWTFYLYDSGGALKIRTLNGDVTTAGARAGETYFLCFRRDSTPNISIRAQRLSDGATASSSTTAGGTGNAASTNPIFVGAQNGATPANTTCNLVVDEFRLWHEYHTNAQVDARAFRELNDEEISNANLKAYYKFNDSSSQKFVTDLSIYRNHGHLYVSGPSIVPGIVPEGSEDSYALRGDGVDDYGSGTYSTEYATILNTSKYWTVELWARRDTNVVPSTTETLLHLGDYASTGAGQRGAVFTIEMTTGGLLQVRYSTTTTGQNTAIVFTTSYAFEYNTPVHIAVVRADTEIYIFINGVLWETETGIASENGPSTSTSYGMSFLCRNTGGTRAQFATFTLDEVRLWKTPRRREEIAQWYKREFPDVDHEDLVGYWRFNSSDTDLDETGNSTLTLSPSDAGPSFTQGLVYPRSPSKQIKLICPIAKPIRTDEVNRGIALADREILVATKDSFWTQQGSEMRHLSTLPVSGSDNLYSRAEFLGWAVFCNGVGRNWGYDGTRVPFSISLPAFSTTTIVATPTGAGSSWPLAAGAYFYSWTWYDSVHDIEGAAGGLSTLKTATMAATHDTCEITALPTSLSGYPQVTHIRIYRSTTAASTTLGLIGTVAIGTSTFSDTGLTASTTTLVPTSVDFYSPTPQNYCAVYNNRLFLARGSDLIYTEADSTDFLTTNLIFVDSDDGDSITGLFSGYGQLIIFKKNSIHSLTGDGPTTFNLQRVSTNTGCLSGHTIAASPLGVYFLGHDGVYRWPGQGQPQYISHSNQPLFANVEHDRAHLCSAIYHPETRQYLLSLDLAGDIATTGVSSTDDISEASKPAAAAYDSPDLQSLFTHFYKFDDVFGGLDAKGTGGNATQTYFDTDVDDDERGRVAESLLTNTGNGTEWTTSLVHSSASGDWTVGFWRKFRSSANDGAPLDDVTFMVLADADDFSTFWFRVDNGSFFTSGSNSIMYIETGDDGEIMSAFLSATSWIHLVVVKSGTSVKLYANGTLISTATMTNPSTIYDEWRAQDLGVLGGPQAEGVLIDNFFWCDGTALNASQVKDIYDYERAGAAVPLVNDIEVSTEESTLLSMIFDEETETWALHDKKFDYHALAEHTTRTSEVLSGYNCHVVRQFDSDADGADTDDLTADYVRSGTFSAVTPSTELDLSGDATNLPATKGIGELVGCEFVIVPTTAGVPDFDNVQKFTILRNTADTIWINTIPDPNSGSTTITGNWYIAPIYQYFETPWFPLSPDGTVSVSQYIQMYVGEVASDTIYVYYKTDQYETWRLLEVATDDEFVRMLLRARGRKYKLKFVHITIDNTAEVESFQLQFAPQSVI